MDKTLKHVMLFKKMKNDVMVRNKITWLYLYQRRFSDTTEIDGTAQTMRTKLQRTISYLALFIPNMSIGSKGYVILK